MGPKVEAACRFVEQGGDRAVITSLDRLAAAVEDGYGTVIHHSSSIHESVTLSTRRND
jgi:carbamate kinase